MARKPSPSKPARAPAEKMLQGLEKGPVEPVYLFYGEEKYLVRKAVGIIRKRVLASSDLSELLFYSFYGSEMDGDTVSNHAKSMPFFGKTQLILIWEAEKIKEKDQKILQEYTTDPAPFSCLVFVAGDNLPKGSFFNHLKKDYPNNCLGFSRLNQTQRQKWLQKMAREKGLVPGLKGDFLNDLISSGHQLEALETQLEILALYLQGRQEKDFSDPLPFGPPEISFKQGYLLTEALMQKNIQEVLRKINHFMSFGVSPLVILSRISQEIRGIWILKEGMEKGEDIDLLLRVGRIPVFKKGLYLSLTRRISWESLRLIYSYLRAADRSLKSSRLDPQWHLEELCGQIVHLIN